MRKIFFIVALAAQFFSVRTWADSGQLENDSVVWQWQTAAGKLNSTLQDKLDGSSFKITGEPFQIILANGRVLKLSDFSATKKVARNELSANAQSPVAAQHFSGEQVVWELADAPDHLTASLKTSLRKGATYVRQELNLKASGGDVLIKAITFFDQPLANARVAGTVDGSPIIAGTFFFGYEHPMAQNKVSGNAVKCSLERNAILKDGESLTQSFVIGALPGRGQERRAFLAYIERERAHPYRPFLHYNSWFDIAWDRRKFDEAESLNAISQFGHQLVEQRHVQMDSFLFDDGWDDNKSLWKFHSGFPNGFTPLKSAAEKYHSGIGVWVSPFGGYDEARTQRLKYASQFGYETNANGFSLAGPKYYSRFHEICVEMIQKYGVNQFKFDGLAAGAQANQNGLARDGDAMLELVSDLRTIDPNIYINQTTGTWPSPFWLLAVDSIWRGGDDHNFQGRGTWCQQWITYRDAQTFDNVAKAGPLYPLNALMLHGVIYATNASHLGKISDSDFADQVRIFFGSGTQLQELYLTPGLLNQKNWDDLAEAANWSRRNADVLADTHWVGGNPGKDEVYGWAAWSRRGGILVLRNPSDKPATFTASLEKVFELPANEGGIFQLKNPWKDQSGFIPLELPATQIHLFKLRPFEVIVAEALPERSDNHITAAVSKTSTVAKGSSLQ